MRRDDPKKDGLKTSASALTTKTAMPIRNNAAREMRIGRKLEAYKQKSTRQPRRRRSRAQDGDRSGKIEQEANCNAPSKPEAKLFIIERSATIAIMWSQRHQHC